MRIQLISVGTRGDMEPFLAAGFILQQRGHEVELLMPEQFRNLAEDADLPFATLGSEFIDMLNSADGKAAMGGGSNFFKTIPAILRLVRVQKPVNKQLIQRQEAAVLNFKPDKIIHSGKAIYPLIWAATHPNQTALLSPVPYMHYVRERAHISINRDLGPWLNKLTYDLANFALIKTISGSTKYVEGGKRYTTGQIKEAMFSNQGIYSISPALFPKPSYWDKRLSVVGYHERNKQQNWQPTQDIIEFLKCHKKVLFITFGSMVNGQPEEVTQTVLNVLGRLKIPAIVNTAAGGLIAPASYNKNRFHFVNRIPYDWILSKVYAVVHHGGSGTTHLGLKYGCATMIIPHIIDQFVWNTISSGLGAGPKGMSINKLGEKNFERSVNDLFENPNYKTAAEKMGKQMMAEDLEDRLVDELVR